MALPRLTYVARDNNGVSARTSLWLPAATDFAGADAFALASAPDLQGLSLAGILSGFGYWTFPGPAGAPAPGARSEAGMTLIYSDGVFYAQISIPGARAGLAETSGPYAGERITRATLQAAGLLDEVESLVAGTVTEDGAPFPASFLVGTYDKVTD